MALSYSFCRCAGGLGSRILFNEYNQVLEPKVETVFISKTSDIDDNGRIIGSQEALRPLTLCKCSCKLLTTAVCRGLHLYTMRCIDPSQRCVSSRLTTGNIFEIETRAPAHVVCALQESGILLTDFAAAYSSVNLSWIFHVLEKTDLFEVICLFLRTVYYSTTRVEFAGMTRGQFFTARSVRQGCPASGFLFVMAFDPMLLSTRRDHSKEHCWPGLPTACSVCVC